MPTDVVVSAGPSISVTLNKNVLTTVETETTSVHVSPAKKAETVVSTATVSTPLTVSEPAKNKVSVTQQITKVVDVAPQAPNEVTILAKGAKGDKGDPGEPGPAGADGAPGSGSLFNDPAPQLGANLDLQTFSLFTSSTNQDITFTPSGTGSINLDGTLKFKRFEVDAPPSPFAGGMYADKEDNLYFGIDD